MNIGLLALACCGERLPLQVLRSAAGYYLGTSKDGLPFSRESVQYWPNEAAAQVAMVKGLWTQRLEP